MRAKDVTSLLETFILFSTNMLSSIVDFTDVKINKFYVKFQNTMDKSDKYAHCRTTNLLEVKSFISIFLCRSRP